MRFALFNQRAAKVNALNLQANRLWTAGLGAFSDWTVEELKSLRGWQGVASSTRGHGSLQAGGALSLSQVSVTLPEQHSWTHLKALQNIVLQGSCGSCWAVTTATVLASHAEIYNVSQRSFASQDLVNCVPNPSSCGGTGGCLGATVELAMHYIVHRGLRSAEEVPYVAETRACEAHRRNAALFDSIQTDISTYDADMHGTQFHRPGVHFSPQTSAGFISLGMKAWERLPENSYEPLLRAVYERGPVAVSVSAGDWDLYSNGIFDECSVDAVIDHAVTLVGFGVDHKLNAKYWLVQNSWGPDWGEGGRIRLLRRSHDETEFCGTDQQPEKGTGCKDGPTSVKVCGMCGILYDNVVPHFK